MSKFFSNRTSVCNLICALLLAVLLVLHFTPFWTYGENGETSAIQGYIWFPSDHGELEKYFEEATGADHDINSILGMPILVLLLGTVGALFCLIKSDQMWTAIFPVACGVSGLWGYLSKAVFKLGTNWGLHLTLCIALIAMGAISLVIGYKDMKNI